MIDADPLFEDLAHDDFHLSRVSPCINMGANENAPDHDFENHYRPWMGLTDIGADEFYGTHSLSAGPFIIYETHGGSVNLIWMPGSHTQDEIISFLFPSAGRHLVRTCPGAISYCRLTGTP